MVPTAYPSTPSPRREAPARPLDLLALYEPGDFYLCTRSRQILARGAQAVVPDAASAAATTRELLGELAARTGGARGDGGAPPRRPLVVGALGFDAATPSTLVVPLELVEAGVSRGTPQPAPGGLNPALAPVRAAHPRPAPAEYVRAVEQATAILSRGELRKVVLARALDVETTVPLDPRRVLRELGRRNPGAFVFAADLPGGETGRPRTLVGASPELLMARAGREVHSQPLAGSAPRAADPAEDQARAAALLESSKDRHEHALVVEALARALAPLCRTLRVPERPSLLSTPTMWHLATRLSGELHDPRLSSLDLALAVHPTPAVCGSPSGPARALIGDLEAFPRQYYAGLIGWCDASGDGEWAVTLRCAELCGPVARLYAGAGIVAGSEGARELDETSAKLRTMLDALGVAREGMP